MTFNPATFRFLLNMFEAGPLHHTYADLKQRLLNQDIEEIIQLAYQPDGYEMFYPAEDMDDEDRPVEEIEPGQSAYFDRDWHPVNEQDIKRYPLPHGLAAQSSESRIAFIRDHSGSVTRTALVAGRVPASGSASAYLADTQVVQWRRV